MPEALKDLFFDKALILNMGDQLARHDPDFDQAGFVRAASRKLSTLELKQRSAQITQALHRYLPSDFPNAAAVLRHSLRPMQDDGLSAVGNPEAGLAGWAIMPMSLYVAESGLDHLELSLALLKEMTKRFTAEFAIRFFLIEHQEGTLRTLRGWTRDPNPHVRRLVSEGTRPRLPWAVRLKAFVADPSPILPLLERLKRERVFFVRRSVANNLNDIAKDHPEVVLEVARRWKGRHPETDEIVRHGCRTLLKRGHPEALALFGFEKLRIRDPRLELERKVLRIGETLRFRLTGRIAARGPTKLRLEYAVEFAKASGRRSRKVFKISERSLSGGRIDVTRRHRFVDQSTRKHHPGRHALELIVNGSVAARADFQLRPAARLA